MAASVGLERRDGDWKEKKEGFSGMMFCRRFAVRGRTVGVGAVLWMGWLSASGIVQAQPAYTKLRINEIIANNNSVSPTNCNCRHVDMVEVYNPTDEQVLLYWEVPNPGGQGTQKLSLALSDGTTVWKFQSRHKINPGDHFVVFCDAVDGKAAECKSTDQCSVLPEQAFDEAHATFGLDRDGETVSLLGPDGALIDEVTFPPLFGDVSYGRFPDGADNFVFSAKISAASDATTFGTCQRPPTLPGIVCSGSPNSSGSNVPPQIDLADYEPAAPLSGEKMMVRAEVKDEKLPDPADITRAEIVYRADGGSEQTVGLSFVGIETNDVNLLDQWSVWEGELPAHGEGTVVDFYLRVVDQGGKSGTAPKRICPYPTGPCELDPRTNQFPGGCSEECQVPYRFVVGSAYAGPLVINEVVPENHGLIPDPSESYPCLDENNKPDPSQRCHFDDFIEIYNASGEDQDLAGLVLTSRPLHAAQGWRFPDGSLIRAGQHLVVWVDGDGAYEQGRVDPNNPSEQAFHSDFGVDGRSDEVFLFAPKEGPGSQTVYLMLDGMRWGRPGEPIDTRGTFVPSGAVWKFFKGSGQNPPDRPDPDNLSVLLPWTHPGYVDQTWDQGPTGIGYGAPGLATVLADMRGSYLAVFCRATFTVPDELFERKSDTAHQVLVKRLFLEIEYDDGFLAYLNGRPVARRNLVRGGYADAATKSISATRELFDITEAKDGLMKGAGENVLAVEVHNATLDGDDLVFKARLFWGIEGLGNDEALARFPDGAIDGREYKVAGASVTPGAANKPPFKLFRRGDVGSPSDGLTDISDAIAILNYLFLGGNDPECLDSADIDDNGSVDISDPVNLLSYLYLGGEPPRPPGAADCGPDGTQDDPLLECSDKNCN